MSKSKWRALFFIGVIVGFSSGTVKAQDLFSFTGVGALANLLQAQDNSIQSKKQGGGMDPAIAVYLN